MMSPHHLVTTHEVMWHYSSLTSAPGNLIERQHNTRWCGSNTCGCVGTWSNWGRGEVSSRCCVPSVTPPRRRRRRSREEGSTSRTRRWSCAWAEGWGGCFCCSGPAGGEEKSLAQMCVFYTNTLMLVLWHQHCCCCGLSGPRLTLQKNTVTILNPFPK